MIKKPYQPLHRVIHLRLKRSSRSPEGRIALVKKLCDNLVMREKIETT